MRNFKTEAEQDYFTKKFCSGLQNARKMACVTQEEMAKETGLTKNYVSALERGINKLSLKTFIEYCETCSVDPNTLLGWNMNKMEITKEELDKMGIVKNSDKIEMTKEEFNRSTDIHNSRGIRFNIICDITLN